MLELALRRAGVPPSKFTAEVNDVALDEMNLLFKEMLNLGIQLWGRDQVILPIYPWQNQVPTPAGTSMVISINQRYQSRITNLSVFSTNGGDPALAFDDDFDTACTQTSPEGSIGALFQAETLVTTIGVLTGIAGDYTYFLEYTQDAGVTWVSYQMITQVAEDRQWIYTDVYGAPPADGWRVRSVNADMNLSIRELYLSNNPTEIPIGPWNLDEWNAMVSKTTTGVPWNWYQQRNIDNPVLYIWPMPDETAKYYQFVCWRRRYLDVVTALTQAMDVSQRWYEAMTASLARRLCRSLPEVADMGRYAMLQTEESQAISLAAGEERDPAPIKYDPGIYVYTRS